MGFSQIQREVLVAAMCRFGVSGVVSVTVRQAGVFSLVGH
jgi:hypothetical protein